MAAAVAFSLRIPAPPSGLLVGDLQHWGHAWLATQSGWQPQQLVPPQRVHGWAMQYRSSWASVYAARDTIWLQVGRRGWDCTDLTSVQQRYARRRTVSYQLHFASGTTTRITLRMPREAIRARRDDPTYDELDSLADDLLKVFPYRAHDGWSASEETCTQWRQRTVAIWAAGMDHGPRRTGDSPANS